MIAGINRPTVAYVSLKKIVSNYQKIKSSVADNTIVYAVVKANAYGHGAIEVSHALSQANADAFAVAITDEALELRDNNIVEPILVMGLSSAKDAPQHAELNISTTVMSKEWLSEAKNEMIKEKHKKSLKVHLKIDSGMGRIGIRTVEEAQSIIDYINENKRYFYLEGIFTHYATADAYDDYSLAKQKEQKDIFKNFKTSINLDDVENKVIWHQSNSAMTLFHPEETLDAIRPGSALYGINPSMGAIDVPLDLESTLSFETELINVKQMKAGETVSYGATYTAKEDEWVGTLPVGYADGWIRDYKGIEILIDGEFVPIVGTICMDQCMVRLPDELPLDTKVTLIGTQEDKSITLDDLAEYSDTMNLEAVCLISSRVPRIYD